MNWITLEDEPKPVATPVPIIYSTSPKIASASDGNQYFIKGPQTEVLVAEAVSYELAVFLGLDVPEWAFCHMPADGVIIYFASKEIRMRSGIDQVLRRRDLILNPEFPQNLVAFDVWISNRDRNLGGIVAEPVGGRTGAEVRLVAIDFEKADILRGISRFIVTRDYTPRDCWPPNDLGAHFAGLPLPNAMCAKIASMTKDTIAGIFHEVAFALAGHSVTWGASASDFLTSRCHRIEELVREAWR
jgi:hypothetical protein